MISEPIEIRLARVSFEEESKSGDHRREKREEGKHISNPAAHEGRRSEQQQKQPNHGLEGVAPDCPVRSARRGQSSRAQQPPTGFQRRDKDKDNHDKVFQEQSGPFLVRRAFAPYRSIFLQFD